MTHEQVEKARRILLDHEYGRRFVPMDVRDILQQVLTDNAEKVDWLDRWRRAAEAEAEERARAAAARGYK